MHQRKTTTNNEPGAGQCPASFQTPDGRRWYCQNQQHRRLPLNQQRTPHRFDVARHPVEWTGTAAEKTSYCGHDLCTGKPAAPTPATPVEVADFHPDQNDATKEV